jgi:hypothetical protein
MAHHHNEEDEKNYKTIFRLVGTLTGLFIGVVINQTWQLVVILGVVGFLFAGFFRQLLVKGRENA